MSDAASGRIERSEPVAIGIHGTVEPEIEGHLRRTLEVAARSLDLSGIDLHITEGRDELPRELVAGAGAQGLWMRSELLRETGVYVAATLLEEAAHHKLILEGVPDGLDTFGGALVHEFFGTWFCFRELLNVRPEIARLYDDGPILPGAPSPRVGYRLGKILGAAEAGVPAAQRRVEEWFASGTIDPGVRAAAERLRRVARSRSDPPDMAAALAGLAATA